MIPSLDETLFPLEPRRQYSANELFRVLYSERENHHLTVAVNRGALKKDRSTNQLKYGKINQSFAKTLEVSLEDSELHSIEFEFVRKGINPESEYEDFVDFWYELKVDDGRQKTYRVTAYAVSNRMNDFVGTNLLQPKKGGPKAKKKPR